MSDIMSAFGALKSKIKFVSIEHETEEMEKAIGKEIRERYERLTKAGADIVFYSGEEFLEASVAQAEREDAEKAAKANEQK